MNEEWLQLAHGEIDGVNSSDDSMRLHRLMDEHPELKKLVDDMRTMNESLSGVQPAEPPGNMTFRIMNEIRRQTSAQRVRTAWAPRWRLGFGFGLGFAAAWIVSLLIGDWPGDFRHLSGVMTTWEEEYRIVDSSRIRTDSLAGEIKAGRSAESVRIDLALDTRMTVDISMNWEPERLSLRSFESDRATQVSIAPGSVVIRHDGVGGYAVTLAMTQPMGPVDLHIASGSGTVLRRRFFVP